MRTEGRIETGCVMDSHLVHLVDDDGLPIRVFASVNHEDDAPRLARAWNCHDELVMWARMYKERLEVENDIGRFPGTHGELIRKLGAVLARAGGDA